VSTFFPINPAFNSQFLHVVLLHLYIMAATHPPIDNASYPVDTIRHVGGFDNKSYTYYPVLVIGAGESGIAMGCRLRQKLGFDQFRIFERKSGIGGTWYTNRYPGIACDVYVPMQLHSLNR
jgi:hypothetical protein